MASKTSSTKLGSYHYQRLSSARSIRVLELQPGLRFADPLESNLREISLDTNSSSVPSYEALSYVWGAPTGDRPITCDGKLLQVTPNCESALRHLREEHYPRTLWIDSICIDQSDDKDSLVERDAQVAMMGEIYNRASSTLCWVGEGEEFTDKAMKRLESIGRCPSQRGLQKLLQLDGKLWHIAR